ncbi:MAG: hypothetical protein IJX47_02430 [Clostridia bacterium]|nr:hypothetical protein [Clostridia bacterium]
MKRKLKPGAEKKLRWIRRLAAVMQAVAVVIFFLLAVQADPRWGNVIKAAITVGGLWFWIEVYEAANELLTGYIYN